MLYFLCPNDKNTPCGELSSLGEQMTFVTENVVKILTGEQLSVAKLADAMVICATWMSFHGLMYQLIPGPVHRGTRLRTGDSLNYPINGHRQFWLTMVILYYGYPKFDRDGRFEGFGACDLSWCYDNFIALATASIIWAFLLSVALYIASFRSGTLLAEGGDTGSTVYDFFIGRELNPRIPGTIFDAKFFCELRPGLIGLVALNMGMAQKQAQLHGHVSWDMYSINLFQVYSLKCKYSHALSSILTISFTSRTR